MKNVVEDVVFDEVIKELRFIDETSYQQFKQGMCKTDDYFSFEELVILSRSFNTI